MAKNVGWLAVADGAIKTHLRPLTYVHSMSHPGENEHKVKEGVFAMCRSNVETISISIAFSICTNFSPPQIGQLGKMNESVAVGGGRS